MPRNILMLLAAFCAASCGGDTPEGIPAEGPMCVSEWYCDIACERSEWRCSQQCFEHAGEGELRRDFDDVDLSDSFLSMQMDIAMPRVETKWRTACSQACRAGHLECNEECGARADRCAVLEHPDEAQDDPGVSF